MPCFVSPIVTSIASSQVCYEGVWYVMIASGDAKGVLRLSLWKARARATTADAPPRVMYAATGG